MVTIWTNLVDLESSMLHTMIQRFLGCGEELLSVLPYTGMAVMLFGTIWTNWQYSFNRRPHMKFGENCLSGFREEDI